MVSGKLDLYAKHKEEYAAPRANPRCMTVRPARYLAIEAAVIPPARLSRPRSAALNAVAFTVKTARKAGGRDFTVSKLEGLWWGKQAQWSFLDEPRVELALATADPRAGLDPGQ